MKTTFLLLLVFTTHLISAQDSIPIPTLDTIETHSQIFSLSPISKKVDKVNGLVFGVGHYENRNIESQTINGINIDVNPIGLGIPFFVLAAGDAITKKGNFIRSDHPNLIVEIESEFPQLKVNGFNLSAGCFFTNTSLNGLNISLFNRFKTFNGVSITPLGTQADLLNGVTVGLYSGANTCNGLNICLLNETIQLKGLQIGIYNYAQQVSGLQIGLFNVSRKRGLQIGVWNVNSKRSMPFINW